MSLTPPPGRGTRPFSRATRFAASVRGRAGRVPAAPRTAWRPGRDHARRHGRPSAVDRVLRRPVQPAAHHHWHRAAGARWDLRLTLPAAPRTGPLPPMTVVRPAAGDRRRPSAARPAAVAARPGPRRPALVHRSAVRRDPAPPPLVTVLRLPPGAPSSASAPHGGPPPAAPVPLVHRRPDAPAHRPGPGPAATAPPHPYVPGAAAPAPGPFAPPPPGTAAAAALTSKDMPVVVDHVVREIDRRMTAARERRGWLA